MRDSVEAERLARTYVWWQSPETTLREPRRLLSQILEMGRQEDFVAAQNLWGRAALRDALLTAKHGEISAKSRNFWQAWFSAGDT